MSGFLIDISRDHPHSIAVQLVPSNTSRTKYIKEMIKLRKSFEDILTNPESDKTAESSVSDGRATSKSGTSSSSSNSNDRSEVSKSGESSGTSSVSSNGVNGKPKTTFLFHWTDLKVFHPYHLQSCSL